jgi:hypothetical protein
MYEWNDILIVGDSFASSRETMNHWPVALTTKLTGESYQQNRHPRGEGFSGGAWWSTRNNLLKELAMCVPKVLIMCHTNEDRIPSDYDFGLTSGCLDVGKFIRGPGDDARYSTEVFNASRQYFKYLFSPSFHQWASEQWFNELDSILSKNKIPIIIHLHCFPGKTPGIVTRGSGIPRVFSHGITSAEILSNLVQDTYNNNFDQSSGNFANHFKFPENIKIADTLYDAVMNYKTEQNGTVQNLNLLPQ